MLIFCPLCYPAVLKILTYYAPYYAQEQQLCSAHTVYYGHLGTNHKCPDYQGVLIFQVSLYDKAAPFGTITKCVDYAGVHIFKCPD